MRKFILPFCTFLLVLMHFKSFSQVCSPDSNKISFTGAAPAPWAIDGLTTDWVTILGAYTGNRNDPYIPPQASAFNYTKEGPGYFGDKDSPNPTNDINFTALTNDDYNFYFYFRRVLVSNAPASFFYFIDVNADGYMNTGEPVFGAQFNGKEVGPLTLYSYVPDITRDYVAGKGNYIINPNGFYVDGYSMKGSLVEIFSASTIPAQHLPGANEVFEAAITEDGHGVELSIPWKYLRNWSTMSTPLTSAYIFTYHIALQKGGGSYSEQSVKDNVGGCCGFLAASGNAKVSVGLTSIVPVGDGNTYKMAITLQNLTSAYETYFALSVSLNNIVLKAGASLAPQDVSMNIYRDWNVNGNIDAGDDLTEYGSGPTEFFYSPPTLIPAIATAAPFSTGGFIIMISFPANMVQSMNVIFRPGVRFGGFITEILGLIYCTEHTGGGKPINPIGFTIETEEEVPGSQLKVESEDHGQLPRVVPNPARGNATLWLQQGKGPADIGLFNSTGNMIRSWKGISNSRLSLQDLKPGTYFINILYPGTGKRYVQKIIIL